MWIASSDFGNGVFAGERVGELGRGRSVVGIILVISATAAEMVLHSTNAQSPHDDTRATPVMNHD